ncbi:TPA: hypothetical protein ACNVV3_000349 [Pseudomonas putida]
MSGAEDLARLTQTIDKTDELLLSPVPKMMDVGGGVMRPTNALVMTNLATLLGGAMPYASVALGLAGTVDGTNFSVLSSADDEYVTVYRHEAGTAVYVDSYPNATKVRAVSDAVDGVDTRLLETESRTKGVQGRKIPNTGFVVIDSKSGKCLWTDGQGRTHSLAHDTLQQWVNGVLQIPQVKIRAKGVAYTFGGNNRLPLVVVKADGWIKLPRLDVKELLVGGKPIGASVALNLRDTYMRNGELLKYHANPLSVSGWGSSSMAGIANEMAAMTSELNAAASYYNGGKGGEQSTHIAARLGSVPMLLTVQGGSIPSTGAVTVTASNANPSASLKAYTGWLNGVHGTLASTSTVMFFTRTTDGAAVPSSGEFKFTPEIGPQHRNDVVLLWMGKNDPPQYGAQSIIARTDASFDWLAAFIVRCLVLGHFHDSNTLPDSAEALTLDAVNAAHRARYGDLFIDVEAYILSAQVWLHTGITPTAQDLEQQAMRQKPASLSADNGHLNAAAYKAIHENLIKPRILQLGWY